MFAVRVDVIGSLLARVLICIGGLCACPALAAPTKAAVTDFLRSYLGRFPVAEDGSTRFSFASINGSDGRTEAVVVYVSGRRWCGSGGCTLLVLKPHGSAYETIGRIMIVWPPIRLLQTESNGRRDLEVWVQGGGVIPGYRAILQFDGKAYRKRAERRVSSSFGRALITEDTQSYPLF